MQLPFAHDFRNPDFTKVFVHRAAALNRIRSSESPALTVARMKQYYRANIGQFTIDWGCTYDPRNLERRLPAIMPFLLFEKQQEWFHFVDECWRSQKDGLTEKSRDSGVTWLAVAFSVEKWLFEPGMAVGFGSRKEDLVDRIGDPDSIFEKIRMYVRFLPPEFHPAGRPNGEKAWRRYDEKKDASHMKMINIENGATITGEAGDNIGRGGRKAIYFKDESAFYERPKRIEAALSQNSNCKQDISTPNGNGNPFYVKRFGGKIPLFTFSWRNDPRKDEAWYQRQLETLDAVTVAQEIDIDYSASIEGVCIPGKYVQAAINLAERLGLQPSGQKRVGLDVADEEGKDDNVVCAAHGMVIGELDTWRGQDTHQTTHKAAAFAQNIGAAYVNYDSIGVGAGVRASSKSLHTPFYGIATSESPLRGNVIDNSEKLNIDHYLNLRSQMWWEMRIRCQRAFQHVNNIRKWSLDEMVSLPNHPGLIAELSQPLFWYTDAGKIQIESKKEMAKRGISSPNHADSALLSLVNPSTKAHARGHRQQSNSAGWT